MAFFRMLHRAAFICNICFLLAIWILWYKHPVNPGLTSLLLVMGFFVSVVLNIVVNFWLLFLRLSRKPLEGIPPRWLIILNGGFLAVQLILLFK